MLEIIKEHGGLVVDGAEIAKRGVPPCRVVERFDVVKHRSGESGSGWPVVSVKELALQRREEGLGHGVVQGVADGAHRPEQACGAQSLPEHP